jgi:glycosyltransferase involved in cell wall biosynthesis
MLSAFQELGYLVGRRPYSVIVTNPPVFPSMLAYGYARITGATFLLDSHPDAFRRDGPHAPFLPIHSWLVRRARAVLVASDEVGDTVRRWGGTPVVIHEAPPKWDVAAPPPALPERPTVVVLGRLAEDEPIRELVDAARLVPAARFVVTGDPGDHDGLVESAPSNVTFVGYLSASAYVAAIERSSLAVVLTNRLQTAVPRSACEAVFARRPLVVSDSENMRRYFPFAVRVDNVAGSIADGVSDALARYGELVRTVDDARTHQLQRWSAQLRALRRFAAAKPS